MSITDQTRRLAPTRRTSTVADAMRAVTDDARVAASPYCSTPTTLLTGLAARVHAVSNVGLSAGLLLGDLPFFEEASQGLLTFRTWHLSADGRTLAKTAALEYIPARARDIAAHLRARVDVALVRVTPPDASGYCSLGPSASYTRDLLCGAKMRIAEIDPHLPRTRGDDARFPYADFDAVVDSDTAAPTYPYGQSSPDATAIGQHVASLVDHGACIQLGIGAVSEAVASALAQSDIGDLQIVGMLSDSMVQLVSAGKVRTGRGAIKVAEVLGTEPLFTFAHDNPWIEMKSSLSMHDPLWLARHSGLVSVCSALEVDLTGQVASEQAGGRAIAGVGGSADFFEGANLSDGGLRVVALPSTTSGGRSRISAALPTGTPVTLPRHSVDVVVTEHGVARLTGLSLNERRHALIAIADPSHRTALSNS